MCDNTPCFVSDTEKLHKLSSNGLFSVSTMALASGYMLILRVK